ncbi:ATP-binding cassette domain-containing protein [bacterium]|nr:ATP-binding cassette domain-containing protein [bacterium]
MQKPIIEARAVSKVYQSGEKAVEILHGLDFDVDKGQTVAITGPSGSGKTTLLGLLAGLDTLTKGSIKIDSEALEQLSEDGRAALRLSKMGFVFQNFQLLPNLTALENIMVPLELTCHSKPQENAMQLLNRVGLANRHSNYPTQLSGGEQQRVAIARAFAHKPIILMADEPTGNLDGETSEMIENLLFSLNEQLNTTLIIVTHDLELAAKTHRIIKLKNGRIEE